MSLAKTDVLTRRHTDHFRRQKEVFMFSTSPHLHFPIAFIEFLARVGSVASITFLFLLFIGEGLHPSQISTNEWAGLIFFPIGVVIGMVIAWWKEAVGSVITLTSLLGFYVVWGFLLHNHIGGWWFVMLASPGLLFLLHWLMCNVEQRYAHR
jgi:hypothetical protein